MKPTHNDPSNGNGYLKSKDIYLSSVLKIHDIPLVKVETLNGGRCLFVFQHTKNLDEIVAKFFNKELEVEPQALFDIWRSLKALMYSQTNNFR